MHSQTTSERTSRWSQGSKGTVREVIFRSPPAATRIRSGGGDMEHRVLLFPDLDEYGIAVEQTGDGGVRLVGAEGAVVGDLSTSVVGCEGDRPAPVFASTRFKDWYAGSGLTGLAFAPAAGDLHEVRITGVAKSGRGRIDAWDGSSFFAPDGHQALLWCTAEAAEQVEAAGFDVEVRPARDFLR
jgi:hypothetical protein